MIPKISIIMTAHNRERYIGKAIESVLAQTYKDRIYFMPSFLPSGKA
jgi:glycosyltransferase involved in cell wall biosynthesis